MEVVKELVERVRSLFHCFLGREKNQLGSRNIFLGSIEEQ